MDNRNGGKFFHKADVIVIAALLLLGGGIWGVQALLTRNLPPIAEIYQDGKLAETVRLDSGQDRSFSIDGEENVIFHLYADGGIAFLTSDCPDKVCVRSGVLHRVGQSAACLPNKIILKIVDKDKNTDSNVDMVIP